VIVGCVNSTSCTFSATGSPYITRGEIRYLSCEKEKWVKKQDSLGLDYYRTPWGGWTR
jgi:hypothetical protein